MIIELIGFFLGDCPTPPRPVKGVTVNLREGKIYAILLVQHCDLVAPLVLNLLTSMIKANVSGYMLEIVFYLFNSSIKGVIIENIKYFNLA